MAARIWTFLLALMLVFGVTGCYVKQVRHLASDSALLKVGVSTREEVVIFLGEPDEQQEVGKGVEKWLYRDKDASFLEKTPLIGKHIGSPQYHQVVVTLRNGIVADCVYSSTDEDDMDWANDYSWQRNSK
ncbi:MAG: hypothetical protein ACD_75C01535G0002 [uncultured bacterium]|nr:MAG: hypothetical protein ACD_75C01535G0002 [uncultured bacterium]HBG19805.1 hypothetical protein [Desulfobulbaceae bacterium]